MIDYIIVCLTAVAINLVINICYLNYRGFFGNYFNSLFSYAKNHGDSSFREIDEKLRKLENELFHLTNEMQKNPVSQDKIKNLEKSISALSSMIDEIHQTQGLVFSEQDKLLLEELHTHMTFLEQQMKQFSVQENTISVLEKQISDLQQEIHLLQQTSVSPDMQKQRDAILRLTQNLITLKSQVETLEKTSQIPEDLQTLPAQVQVQKKEILELHQQISDLQKKINSPSLQTKTSHVIENKSRITSTVPAKEPKLEAEILQPDISYIQKLKNNLSFLKNRLGAVEYRHCEETLDKLLRLDEETLEDSEEIMFPVHGMIEKYIYGSDTKVSNEDWAYLEEYIKKAGYTKVPVKAGDNIKPYQTLFSRPIAVKGGTPNTIKHIQLAPYILYYQDGSKTETLKLCGKCSYYQ